MTVPAYFRETIAISSSEDGSSMVVSVNLADSTDSNSMIREQANRASRSNRYEGNRILPPSFSVTIIANFTTWFMLLFCVCSQQRPHLLLEGFKLSLPVVETPFVLFDESHIL